MPPFADEHELLPVTDRALNSLRGAAADWIRPSLGRRATMHAVGLLLAGIDADYRPLELGE